ncbi:hypothetical protein [Oligoflexus tunisiensis]|uniref:hypothetical protein n=1 Tax=Oligoflexus tunisiensis TaxID=708132 RepID=UPI00114CE25B|nr:hypothetical protein [Oligoflexus tunisiensis]
MDYTQSLSFNAICVADPIQAMELIKREYNNIIFVVSDFEMGADAWMIRLRTKNIAIKNPTPFQLPSALCKPSKADQGLGTDPGSRPSYIFIGICA